MFTLLSVFICFVFFTHQRLFYLFHNLVIFFRRVHFGTCVDCNSNRCMYYMLYAIPVSDWDYPLLTHFTKRIKPQKFPILAHYRNSHVLK